MVLETLRRALAVGLLMAIGGCTVQLSAEAAVSSWLHAMTEDGADRGWRLLSVSSQARYGGDRNAYIAEASAQDWTEVRWTIEASHEDDGIHLVFVEVDGGWEAVPAFVRQRPLAQIYCADGIDRGFIVYVTYSLLGNPEIGVGAQTGTTEAGVCR